ncbi:DUF4232 domain-containing protein [Kitasatospora sp. NPDC048296]|uniref:DUF4232 domain-containing protein n=1 Tax=Kitasatospora sp. NPDC048296 TaxID=3364048 RepID=UPI00370FF834
MNVRRPSRLLAAGVAALAATVLLTACNDDAGTDAQPTAPGKVTVPGVTPTKAAPTGATPTHATPTGPAATQPASARCTSDELKADVQIQGPGSAMLMLSNKGSRSCTLFGYPGYGGLGYDNGPLVVATKREPHPGPPESITLKPGVTAFAGLKWSDCAKSDPTCHILAGLQVTPPDETTPLVAQVDGVNAQPVTQLLVSAAGLTTGSLQPVSQSVVFAGP